MHFFHSSCNAKLAPRSGSLLGAGRGHPKGPAQEAGPEARPPRTPPSSHLLGGRGVRGFSLPRVRRLRVLMAHVPSPEGSFAQPPAGARDRLRRVAAVLAHVCGLTLHMKR